MFKRAHSIAAAAFAALTLVGLAIPKAHAEPQTGFAYRAGEITRGKVYQGSRLAVDQLVSPFVGAIHAWVEDDNDDRTWWVIATRDGEEIMAVCPEPTQNNAGTKIVFQGDIVAGSFRGAKVTGTVTEDDNGDVWLQMRVQAAGRGGVDVEFEQRMDPLDIEA